MAGYIKTAGLLTDSALLESLRTPILSFGTLCMYLKRFSLCLLNFYAIVSVLVFYISGVLSLSWMLVLQPIFNYRYVIIQLHLSLILMNPYPNLVVHALNKSTPYFTSPWIWSITIGILKKSISFFTVYFVYDSFHLQVNLHHFIGTFSVIIFQFYYFAYFSPIFNFYHHDIVLGQQEV